MRRALILFPLLVASCCVPGTAELPQPKVPYLENAEPGSGASGVVVAPGWILTAKHALPLGDSTLAVFEHPELDLALVAAPNVEGWVPLAQEAPELGDPLTAWGWHAGEYLLATDGHAGLQLGAMSCPVIPGASGGPVLNEDGELVGVVRAVLWGAMHQPPGEAYVIPHVSWYTPLDLAWINSIIYP